MAEKPPIAVTIGEPAGIGPDVILDLWARATRSGQTSEIAPFYVIGSVGLLQRRARLLGLDVAITPANASDISEIFPHSLPVVPLRASLDGEPGLPDPNDAAAIIESITTAVDHVRKGTARAIVTAPINKKSLYDAGFAHPGHTEFLAELAKTWSGGPFKPVMMLAGPKLRAVPVTIHIPLKDVAGALNSSDIVEMATISAEDLTSRFAIPNPRLAISGLNPHAGEEGAIGKEEQTIIKPAIAALQKAGIDAKGPFPADTMFHQRARDTFDVAICMYHDQALVPAKALDFDLTVNVTLGLPFVRTSPDHGTAFDIAGSGRADPSSMIAALRMADQLSSTS